MRSDRGAIGNIVAVLLGGAAGAGLIVGAILGLTGAAGPVGEPATLADAAVASYYDCPDGEALGTVARGDRVFITGRDASGDWAEIRSPNAPNSRVWMRARQVLPDGETGDLPVLSCNVPVEVIAASATTIPEETSTTAVGDSTTTTSSTTSTSTTTTTVAADTTPPSIGQQQASPGTIWELDGGVFGLTCPGGTPRQATISAIVTDNGAIASVTANWSDPLGSHNVDMGAAGSTYSVTFGNFPADTWDPLHLAPYTHAVTITISARDAAGNESQTTLQVTATEAGECLI